MIWQENVPKLRNAVEAFLEKWIAPDNSGRQQAAAELGELLNLALRYASPSVVATERLEIVSKAVQPYCKVKSHWDETADEVKFTYQPKKGPK